MKLAEKVVKPNTHCPCPLLMPKQSHSQDIWIVKWSTIRSQCTLSLPHENRKPDGLQKGCIGNKWVQVFKYFACRNNWWITTWKESPLFALCWPTTTWSYKKRTLDHKFSLLLSKQVVNVVQYSFNKSLRDLFQILILISEFKRIS